MDADTLFLVLRVIVALGVVVALLWFAKRKLVGGPGGGAAKPGGRRVIGPRQRSGGAALRGRHALGQKSSVAVVEFDGREFLLGVTEQGVTVLHSSAPAPAPAPAPAAPAAPAPAAADPFAVELAAAQAAETSEPTEATEPAAATGGSVPPLSGSAGAPRYRRRGAMEPDRDDESTPYPGLLPEPMPAKRHLVSGQFIAEVQLVSISEPPAPGPISTAPIPPAPIGGGDVVLPTTAMIPTIRMTPAAPSAPTRSDAGTPLPVLTLGAPLESRPSSRLAGSILSPDTWRRTVDALRAVR